MADPPYPFLSDEWIDAARQIHDEYAGAGVPVPEAVKTNLVIRAVPFGDDTMPAHIDTTSGEFVMDVGHLPEPDVTVTLEYGTARAIFVDGTSNAAMQAFLAGKITIEGDFAKLLAALQSITPGAFDANDVQRRIKEITA